MKITPLLLLAFAAMAGCAVYAGEAPAAGGAFPGDPQRGVAVIQEKGCGGCHTIPGVTGAHGLVGPPLLWWSRRTFIAGHLPNTAENLARWIQSPPSVDPGTAMPDLGLSEQQARDVVAYLRTLR